MTVTVSIEVITKETAQQLLESQDVNRPVSWVNVRKYRNDMNAGLWQLNGASIAIDADGHMRDGAHRCHAILGAEVDSFETVIVRGLAAESQRTMDQGRRRTPGNQLSMMGVKDANIVAAGIRLYLSYESGLMFRDNSLTQEHITTTVIEDWASKNLDLIGRLSGFIGDIKGSDAPPSVAYAAALVFEHSRGSALTPKFFRLLHKGAGDATHPITVLDKRLQRHRREGIVIAPREILGLYIQAWNAWVKKRPLTKFQRPRGGHWSESTFPRPIRCAEAVA